MHKKNQLLETISLLIKCSIENIQTIYDHLNPAQLGDMKIDVLV